MQWRAEHAKPITAPNGWLSVVALEWLVPGENTFGAAEGNRLRIPAQKQENRAALAHLGTLVLAGDQLTLRAHTSGFPRQLREDGKAPHEGAFPLEAEKPTTLTAGPFTMTVIHRGVRYALRVKDAQAPARLNYHGLIWFPLDPHYVLDAKWIPYTPPHILHVPTVISTTLEMPSPGVAEFVLDGKTLRLEPVLEDPDAKELFFILRDTTSRTTTDQAARFLYTGLPDHGLTQPGLLHIDFNRLENPSCAYTPYATCPLPLPQNRLGIPLPAGEKRYPLQQ